MYKFCKQAVCTIIPLVWDEGNLQLQGFITVYNIQIILRSNFLSSYLRVPRMEKFTAPDPSNVILTYSDAYNMVYITARRPLSVFYIHKSAVQVILCGVEVVQTFLSGLIRLTIGGMTYEKNSYGIPFYNRFGEFKSAAGVPYKDWPDYIKIVTNSFAAPFLWKVESMSKGIITENLAKDSKGGDISLEQSLLVDGPTEFDLFLRILRRRSLAIPS